MSQDVNAVVLEPSPASGPANLVLYHLQGERAAVTVHQHPLCQGRSKIRPRWRRNTRPSGSGSELLKVASRGEASGSRGGSVVAGFLAVFEAITVAVQLQDVDVMGQPVE